MLNRLIYYGFLMPISLLPFWLLYRVSDFFFLIMYYLVGYRKKVVFANLKGCFPEKTDKELKRIMRKFYQHFLDLVLEAIKGFTVSKKSVLKRMVPTNQEVLEDYYDKNQSVVIAAGHYGNWEMYAVACALIGKMPIHGIYKPLSNKYFDEKMRSTRGRYGVGLINSRKVKETVVGLEKPCTVGFLMDQSPANPQKCYWMDFMGRETGVMFGTEYYARQYNWPVLYCHIYKQKRGHYTYTWEHISEEPILENHGAITEKIMRTLEKDILKEPAFWLWTHRRWKHKKPANLND